MARLRPAHRAARELGWLLHKPVLTPLPGRSSGAGGKGPADRMWPTGHSVPPSDLVISQNIRWLPKGSNPLPRPIQAQPQCLMTVLFSSGKVGQDLVNLHWLRIW